MDFHNLSPLGPCELKLSGIGGSPDSSSTEENKEKHIPGHSLSYGDQQPHAFVTSKTEALPYDNIHLVSPVGHGAGGLALLWKQEINLQVLSASANGIDTCINFEGKIFFSSFIYRVTDRNNRRFL